MLGTHSFDSGAGWLDVYRRKRRDGTKVWSRRYCVLRRRQLCFGKAPDRMTRYLTVASCSKQAGEREAAFTFFRIRSGDAAIHFRSSDPDVAEAWVSALTAAATLPARRAILRASHGGAGGRGSAGARSSSGVRRPARAASRSITFVHVDAKPPLLPTERFLLHRQDLLGRLCAQLLATEGSRVALVSVGGVDGVGRSLLASQVLADKQIRRRYPHGVAWVRLGEDVAAMQLLSYQARIIASLGEKKPSTFLTPSQGTKALARALRGKSCLVVVDDACSQSHVRAFADAVAETSSSSLLVTMRSSALPRQCNLVQIDLPTLDENDATRLLLMHAGPSGSALIEDDRVILRLVRALECHTLSLAVAGAALREVDGPSVHELLFLLEGRAAKRKAFPLLMAWRWQRLPPMLQNALEQCVALPCDRDIPLAVMQLLWQVPDIDVRRTVLEPLFAARLLTPGSSSSHVQVHALVAAYLRQRVRAARDAPRLAQLHQRLLDRAAELRLLPPPAAADAHKRMSPEQAYLVHNLCRHLAAAERLDTLRSVLLTPDWLELRLEMADVFALLHDFAEYRGLHKDVATLEAALKRSRGVLQRSDARSHLPFCVLAFLRGSPHVHTIELQRLVASFSAMATVLPVYPQPLELQLRAQLGGSRSHSVTAVLDLCDTRHVLAGCDDGVLSVWNWRLSTREATLLGHAGAITSLALLPDKRRVASASEDETIRVWDWRLGVLEATLEGHTDAVTAVAAFTSGGVTRLASAGDDNTLRVWTISSADARVFANVAVSCIGVGDPAAPRLHVVLADVSRPGSLVSAASGMSAVSATVRDDSIEQHASRPPPLRLWELGGGTSSKLPHDPCRVSCLHVLADLQHVAVARVGVDADVQVWNHTTRKTTSSLFGLSGHVISMCSLTPSTLALALESGDLVVWHWRSSDDGATDTVGAISRPEVVLPRSGSVVAAGMDGEFILSGGSKGSVSVWDWRVAEEAFRDTARRRGTEWREATTYDVAEVAETLTGHEDKATCVATFGTDWTVSGGADNTLRLWSAQRGCALAVLRGHTDLVTCVQATSEHGSVISAGWDRMLRFWDCKVGKEHRRAVKLDAPANAIAALSGQRVAVGLDDGGISIVDQQSAVCTAPSAHSAYVTGMCVVPEDGERLATSSDDNTVAIWDVYTSEPQRITSFTGHTDTANCVAALDANTLVSGGSDKRILVYDVRAGPTPVQQQHAMQHDGEVNSLALLADQQTIVSAAFDSTLGVWDRRSWSQLQRVAMPVCPWAVAPTAAGNKVAVGLESGFVLWLDLLH